MPTAAPHLAALRLVLSVWPASRLVPPPRPHPEAPERSGGLEGDRQRARRSLEPSFEARRGGHLRRRGRGGSKQRLRQTVTAALLVAATAAEAHPHVWVTARAQLVYADGKVTGVRHAWAFDPEYSSFVTQGLDADKNGKLTPDELAALAATNTENLAEFGYFTKLKIAGKEQAFADPREPAMRMEGNALTLSFLLPLKTPAAPGRGVAAMEIYDPTYFVSFAFAEGADAVTLAAAPQGCTATVTRPKGDGAKVADASGGKTGMSEAFFEALTAAANYGEQFANRVIVACP